MAIRNVREHLSTHHAKSASFDLGIASELQKLRKCFQDLETNADADDALKKVYSDAKEVFDKLGTSFNQHARYHEQMKVACEKSDGVDDLEKRLEPTQVSAVAPTAPASALRAVPRYGQKELGAAAMPVVDPAFQHLVKATDDRE
jgi:hypothetical protein